MVAWCWPLSRTIYLSIVDATEPFLPGDEMGRHVSMTILHAETGEMVRPVGEAEVVMAAMQLGLDLSKFDRDDRNGLVHLWEKR